MTKKKKKEFKLREIVFGADPELFLRKRNGEIVIAQKYFPNKRTARENGEDLYWDGLLLELNPEPDTCREGFLCNIQECLTDAYDRMPKSVRLLSIPGQHVALKVIKSAHPRARIFGCDPDYEVYSGDIHHIDVDAENHPHRYGGGHIHLGVYDGKLNPYLRGDIEDTVKILDIILGVPLVLLERFNYAKLRRRYYGIAGSFRRPRHGLEYRVPSNVWMTHPAIFSLVMELARFAPNIVNSGMAKDFLSAVSEEDIVKSINENNFTLAKKNYHAIRPLLFNIYEKRGKNERTLVGFEYIVKNGIKKVFGFNIKKNWPVDGSTGILHFIENNLERKSEYKKFRKKFDKDKDNIGRQPKMFDTR